MFIVHFFFNLEKVATRPKWWGLDIQAASLASTEFMLLSNFNYIYIFNNFNAKFLS